MQWKDLKIGTQLRLGLGAMLALVLVLGAVAWVQTDRLWLQTESLYAHPLQVRRAVGDIQAQVLTMQRSMLELCLAESEPERDTLRQTLDVCEASIHRDFDIIHTRFLGPPTTIAHAELAFTQWKAIRDETHRLVREGKLAEALRRIRPGGVCGVQVEQVLGAIQQLGEFAMDKADEFYRGSEIGHRNFVIHLALLIGVMLLLTLIVFRFISQGVNSPLAELTTALQLFRRGNLDQRCHYASANEFGSLAATFNTMAEAIQTQTQSDANAIQITGVMFREKDPHAFCRELLKGLLQHTGSQVGAVYFLNAARTTYELFESIGLSTDARADFSAAALEGELGTAVATRQIQRITAIPADSRFALAAVCGSFMPREIMTIPVLADHTITAVISLASIRAYDALATRLVGDIWSLLTARMNSVLATRQLKEFAEQLEQQNRELAGQQQELTTQAAELTEQNTELEMQKRKLDESNRLKSAFLSNMSHELRTPLNAVIALSGVLHRRLANAIPAEEYGYLEVIERNGKNLLMLINDILDLARVEAGRADISISNFSLRELAGEIVALLAPQAQAKGLTLVSHVGADLPQLASDPDKCWHILQNLVSNAVKFTEQGSVEIAAQQVDSEFQVAIRDTGIGIAADQLPNIFDEFRQVDGSTSRKYGGTGLGLAIAKKYALLLGGRISVASTPGQGSTFTLHLPAAPGPADGAPATGQATPSPADSTGPQPTPAGTGHHILVVEDSPPAVLQLQDILQAAGYRVQVARDGREALNQIAQHPPDAMILDLMMPEVDGFQVLKAVRSAAQTAHLPVLILTAKHVCKEELSFLEDNHISELIQKGDVNRHDLLIAVAQMVVPQPVPPSPPEPRRRLRPARPGKPVILVVENNPDNLRAAQALLSEQYEVMEALDGQAAIAQARRHLPDLILLDIAMPVMDGRQVLREIRQDESLRHIPVIAASAHAMKGDREKIIKYGFDGYLAKPLDADLLGKTLRDALA